MMGLGMIWLRPILLLAGALFLLALFLWDRRRSRQAAPPPAVRATRTEPSFEPMAIPTTAPAPAVASEREPRRALPVIDWPVETAGTSAADGRAADGRAGEPGPARAAVLPAAVVVPAMDLPAVELPPMIVDWPAENARRIVTLRVVPAGTDRLPGRAVRQALSACGFRHGEFGIFHLPDEHGRVILSAASLVLPGTLDPAAMDFQRYSGLNLFAVLPGPLSADLALERLGQLSLELAGRVSGHVHDDQGSTLSFGSVAAWRKRLLATLEGTPAGATTAAGAATAATATAATSVGAAAGSDD